ncbi:hypothetical protein AB205_0149620, partial [Aquarana catesbeiana]
VNSSYLTYTNVVYLSSIVTSLTYSTNISCTYPKSMENVLWASTMRVSCPVLNDSTLHVEENGVSLQGRFSLNMTKFAGNYSKYSIDCQTILCNTTLGTCSPNCSQTDPAIVDSVMAITNLTSGALYSDEY